MIKVQDRFLKYIGFDTQSKEDSNSYPSTDKQLALAENMVKELKEIGIENAQMDAYGYVTASIKSNIDKKIPAIGFIAHLDTSPDLSGEHVNARIIPKYDGSDIVLHKEKNIVMRTKEFKHLLNYLDNDLIVTDGTTLLGADDKAGVAEIMAMAETLMQNQEIAHGDIKIAFTPDEEVGNGTEYFDIKKFGADYAYTVDGGEIGEIEFENFNAAAATVLVKGVNIHPGDAKNKMINANLLVMEFNGLLPSNEIPAATEKYEGFYHLQFVESSVEIAKLKYILRDHDKEKFEKRKQTLFDIRDFMNKKYGHDFISVEIKDSYYNMKEKIMPHYHLIENAIEAMNQLGIKPLITPVRGGTDGARLSYEGLPCPNLGTGGHNFHGRYEYIPIQSMEKTVDLLLKIIELSTKRFMNA